MLYNSKLLFLETMKPMSTRLNDSTTYPCLKGSVDVMLKLTQTSGNPH